MTTTMVRSNTTTLLFWLVRQKALLESVVKVSLFYETKRLGHYKRESGPPVLSKLHVFFFPILSFAVFFHHRLFRLFSIDERRGNKSDDATPTRGGSSTGGGGGFFFVSFVRDVFFVPSLSLFVALCVRCVLILFLDHSLFSNQTRENTAPVVTKKTRL